MNDTSVPVNEINAGESNKRRSFPKNLSLLIIGLCLGWFVGLSVSPVIQTVLTSLIALVVVLSSALAGLSTKPTEEGQTKKREKLVLLSESLDPFPIMCLVLGLAVGSSFGIFTRTNDLLGARDNPVIKEWKDTGYKPEDIAKRIFDARYPPLKKEAGGVSQTVEQGKEDGSSKSPELLKDTPASQNNPTSSPPSPEKNERSTDTPENSLMAPKEKQTVLFVEPSPSDCQSVINAEGDELVNKMGSFPDDHRFDELARRFQNDPIRLKQEVKKRCRNRS